jgi:hypothetical protein
MTTPGKASLASVAEAAALHRAVGEPARWMGHLRPAAHEALVSEADFIATQDINAARGPSPRTDLAGPEKRRYLLSGLLVCGTCQRRMESAWSKWQARLPVPPRLHHRQLT